MRRMALLLSLWAPLGLASTTIDTHRAAVDVQVLNFDWSIHPDLHSAAGSTVEGLAMDGSPVGGLSEIPSWVHRYNRRQDVNLQSNVVEKVLFTNALPATLSLAGSNSTNTLCFKYALNSPILDTWVEKPLSFGEFAEVQVSGETLSVSYFLIDSAQQSCSDETIFPGQNTTRPFMTQLLDDPQYAVLDDTVFAAFIANSAQVSLAFINRFVTPEQATESTIVEILINLAYNYTCDVMIRQPGSDSERMITDIAQTQAAVLTFDDCSATGRAGFEYQVRCKDLFNPNITDVYTRTVDGLLGCSGAYNPYVIIGGADGTPEANLYPMSIQQLVGTCEGTGAECYISTNAPSGTITAAPSIVPTASPATFAVPSILPTASPAMFPVETSAPATQSPTTAPNADIIPVTTLTPTAIPTAFPTTLPTADAPEVAVTVVSVFEQLTLAGLTDTEVDTFVINVNNALTTGLQLSDLDVIETSVTSSSLQATSAVRLANAADQEKVEGLVQAEGTKLLSENNGFDVTTYGTPDQVYLQGSRDVPPGDDDGEGESSDLVLVAIVVVIGVLAIALVACAAICYRRRRKRNDRDLSRMEMNSVHSANRMGENPSANVGSRADPDSTGNNFHYHEDFHRRDETRHGFQTNGVHEHTSAPPLPGQMQGNGEPVYVVETFGEDEEYQI